MTASAKLLERMKGHSINSYDELCHCLRVHDAAFINDLGADAIEVLLTDLNNAMQYIPHLCTTCRYWELRKDESSKNNCTRPELKTPCYAWRLENWEWDGKMKL